MIKCPRCDSVQVHRSRRRGIMDRLYAYAGHWPYRCRECSTRFHLPFRAYVPPATQRQEPEGNAGKDSPHMASRRHPDRPLAKIVIEAESHEQLDHILLKLGHAVAESNQFSRAAHTDSAKN